MSWSEPRLREQKSVQGQLGARVPERVAEELSRLIIANHMEAGDQLPSEQSLSERFQVSKRGIREALRVLAAQGIVQTSQGKQAVVARPNALAIEAYFKFMHRLDRTSVLELYELREIIEVRATAIAAKRATAEDLARADSALSVMENAGRVEDYVAGDLAFHAAVIDAAHNRYLSAVMSALSGVLREEREMGVRNRLRAGGSPRAIREHRMILDALSAGDAEKAELLILAHFETTLVYLRSPVAVGRAPKQAKRASTKGPVVSRKVGAR
jgi:GntR family transcriptional repressor for pyruvate dehydrogenase complex